MGELRRSLPLEPEPSSGLAAAGGTLSGSSNGRTLGFEPGNVGSIPTPGPSAEDDVILRTLLLLVAFVAGIFVGWLYFDVARNAIIAEPYTDCRVPQ